MREGEPRPRNKISQYLEHLVSIDSQKMEAESILSQELDSESKAQLEIFVDLRDKCIDVLSSDDKMASGKLNDELRNFADSIKKMDTAGVEDPSGAVASIINNKIMLLMMYLDLFNSGVKESKEIIDKIKNTM